MINIHKAALLLKVSEDSDLWGNASFGGTLRLFYKVNPNDSTDDEFEPELFATSVIKKYKLTGCSFSEIGRQDDGLIDLDIEESQDLKIMSKLIERLKIFSEVTLSFNKSEQSLKSGLLHSSFLLLVLDLLNI
jgi:hypothetical protein